MDDLEILHRLPENSEVRAMLLQRVEGAVRHTFEVEDEARRDPTGILLDALLFGVAIYGGYVAFHQGGWSLLLLAPVTGLASVAYAGLIERHLPKRKRDESGKPVD